MNIGDRLRLIIAHELKKQKDLAHFEELSRNFSRVTVDCVQRL
jgi:hypothetical protein